MSHLIAPLFPMPYIPIGQHPGSFGVERHQHVHTGVDLYAPYGCPVRAMEAGKIIAIDWFTGPSIKMPWWNDTRAVYVEGASGVFNYGEIQEAPNLKVGMTVEQGQILGHVLIVLKKFKGRPMSMLHIELYDHGYTDTWGEWKMGDPKPEHLHDPTPHLLCIPWTSAYPTDPYLDSVALWGEEPPKILELTFVKCAKSTSERYTLREKSWWADIIVSQDGFVNIQSDYGDYHYRWGSFGDDIKRFLIGCDKSYLYNKFGGLLPRVFNQKESIQRIQKDILEYRRTNSFNAESCREFWDITESFNPNHISSTEEWSRVVSDSGLSRLYEYDVSSIPCVTEDNYQLTAFLTIIWPEFIKVLRNETA